MGFEPMTSSLPRKRSTPELRRPWQILAIFVFIKSRAGDEVRTRDLQLGRLSLYQLSYSRNLAKLNLINSIAAEFKILHNLCTVGRGGFEPPKSKDNRFTVCPSWPLWYLPGIHFLKEHSLKN